MTELEQRVLAFAGRTWKHQGAREEAITVEFGMSPWRYEQLLLHVISLPEALVAEPMLVNRLRRLRRVA